MLVPCETSKEANLNMVSAHQVDAEHEPCRRCHQTINYASSTGSFMGTAELLIMLIC